MLIASNFCFSVAILALASLAFTAATAPGCAPAASPAECSDQALAEIEARYSAELVAACYGKAASVAECEDAPPIVAKYDGLRKDWLQCR
jgi:hypothetical protein